MDELRKQDDFRNAVAVKLSDLVSEMEMQFDGFKSFLNLETGEVITVSIEELGAAEEEEELPEGPEELEDDELQLARDIADNYNNYEELPDKYAINEYEIMESFCQSLPDERLCKIMCSAIRGRGAFRRFKDKIQEHGLEEYWYRYRNEALKAIAIDWCEHNRICYIG